MLKKWGIWRKKSYVLRKEPGLCPNDWILHHKSSSAHKELSVKQFLAQRSIAKVKRPIFSSDMARNDSSLFPKTVCFTGTKISGYKYNQKF
jgi:hypothetical protein